MFSKNLNFRAYILPVIFLGVLFLIPKVINMLLTGQVSDEDGVIEGNLMYFFVAAFSVIFINYGIFVLKFICNIISHKGIAFTVDEEGIHNSVITMNILALMFIGSIKLIPWSAVNKLKEKPDGTLSLDINAKVSFTLILSAKADLIF